MDDLKHCLQARDAELFFYSPYNFIRKIDRELQVKKLTEQKVLNTGHSPHEKLVEVNSRGHKHFFSFAYLPWDTDYFKIPTYKLFTVLYGHQDFDVLAEAVSAFKKTLFADQRSYCFIEIPSEDILLIQALCQNQFKLIETRLTYFRGDLKAFDNKRFPVRKAEFSDIDNLKRVAAEMRNVYDRFHADSFFSTAIADQFLSTYVEQAISGLADVVLVPNSPNLPADAFLTAKYLRQEWEAYDCRFSKMVLSAVSGVCKGWYYKLISEMTFHLAEIGTDYIFMNTQSTNRAVFRTWEKLGYELGATTHVFSYHN